MNHLLFLEGLDGGIVAGRMGDVEDGTYMYGPGRSFMALKQRHVSSTRTGPLTCCVC